VTDGAPHLVIDASAVVDLLLQAATSTHIAARLGEHEVVAPAHVDLEVLSALGRLQRAGVLEVPEVERRLALLVRLPISRVPVTELIIGAWQRRASLRLADALYVELAETLGCRLLTTDLRLGRSAAVADVIEP